jgi:hypothetical protein
MNLVGGTRIRKVTASTGIITTIAGDGTTNASGDGGSATSAAVGVVWGLCINGNTLYLVDYINYSIRTIDLTTGIINFLCSTASVTTDQGTLTYNGTGLLIDANNNLYIAGSGVVLKYSIGAGTTTVVAGILNAGGYNGDGIPATTAQLGDPRGLCLGNSGELYIADESANRVRMVKVLQNITYSLFALKKYGDASFTVNATVNSGLGGITYSSSNTSVATVAGNTVTIVGAGNTAITASQAGNSIYDETSTQQSLIVAPAPLTATASDKSRMYGSSNPSFDLSYSGFVNGETSSVIITAPVASTSASVTSNVGTYPITVSGGAAANYSFNYSPGTLTIVPANQTIIFDPFQTVSLGASPMTLPQTAISGLPISYFSSNSAVATVSGNILTIVGTGTSTITASQGGNSNYNAAPDVAQTLIVKLGQSITFNSFPSKQFGAATFNLAATSSSGLGVTYSSADPSVATVAGSTVTIVGVGSTVITASQGGDATYNAAADVTQTLTVTKGDQTVTFGTLPTKSQGDQPFQLTATSSSGLPVVFSVTSGPATVTGNTITLTGAGTVVITASQPGNSSYNAAADVTQTLTVTKGDQTVTFGTLPTKNQGDQPFQLTATSSSGLPVVFSVTSGPATVNGNTVTLTGAGTVVIKASQAGNSNYNAAADTTKSFCVNPSKPAISASFTNTSAPVLTSSSSQGNQWYLNGNSIASSTSPTLNITQAGSYTLIVTIGGCASTTSDAENITVTSVESSSDPAVKIYPNPVSDELFISWVGNESASVTIVDGLGKSTMTGSNELLNHSINVSALSPGFYIIRINSDTRRYVSKFLKK